MYAGALTVPSPLKLQCDHAVEGVECKLTLAEANDLYALQCDHAVEGVECTPNRFTNPHDRLLQCDHAVEGVECPKTPAPPT